VGGLVEHYAGAFPVWLSPTQARVIPIADRHHDYARSVLEQLRAVGLRVDLDDSAERMNAKVRNAQLQKIPYMLIVGDKEIEQHSVSVRLRSEENLGAKALDEFIALAQRAVAEKATV